MTVLNGYFNGPKLRSTTVTLNCPKLLCTNILLDGLKLQPTTVILVSPIRRGFKFTDLFWIGIKKIQQHLEVSKVTKGQLHAD